VKSYCKKCDFQFCVKSRILLWSAIVNDTIERDLQKVFFAFSDEKFFFILSDVVFDAASTGANCFSISHLCEKLLPIKVTGNKPIKVDSAF
jgi:hypothetical protein